MDFNNAEVAKRVRKLINQSRVVVFAKGTPEAAVCSFSTAVFRLLEGAGVDFFSYNVVPDEDVRNGLPLVSNWPTFPQIFLDGQLVGGLKQLEREMRREEFRDKLPMRNAE